VNHGANDGVLNFAVVKVDVAVLIFGSLGIEIVHTMVDESIDG